jgi:Acetyltransferase (GNAT) domain
LQVYDIDPTTDGRWGDFVQDHPRASIFHTAEWLRTLRKAYGYETIAFTTSSPSAPLESAIPFCLIKSRLTKRRLVSLPFSDHCEPLCESAGDMTSLLIYLRGALEKTHCQYFELRPTMNRFAFAERNLSHAGSHFLHVLDLEPDRDSLLAGFDRDSVRRRIGRAERAGLIEKNGNSSDLLNDFYDLFVMSRRRHQLPPAPRAWFRHLTDEMGSRLQIRAAYSNHRAVSAIMTLRFGNTVYYKYGCSDYSFNQLGATPWLFWKAIEAAKSSGARCFDFGRTEKIHAGLLRFKNHWVPKPQQLSYWAFPAASRLRSTRGWKMKAANRIFSSMPNLLLEWTGQMLYRHMG